MAVLLPAVLLILGAALSLFYIKIYRVEPAFAAATYELGDCVSTEVEDYLVGTRWSRELGELDLGGVDQKQPGSYEAVVHHGAEDFTYTIIIRDTVAPRILEREGQVYLTTGEKYLPEDLITGVEDEDFRVETWFLLEGKRTEALSFRETGEYAPEVVAQDSTGNQTRITLPVIVDEPPVLAGIRNFYMVPGSEPDYLEQVEAHDAVDGNLTENIRVDDSLVQSDRKGVYEVSYTVSDTYGLETCGHAEVTVASPEELQELIGQRRINRREDVILGAPNPYDAGASQEENLEETLAYMRPALVQLFHKNGNGYSAGSGYIVEITEDTVYICSNRHVAEKYQQWSVFFYDGTEADGELLGCSEEYDVGVVAVAVADIPAEVSEQLMTVHIDRPYWEQLDEQPLALGLERVNREGGILHTATGSLIKVKQYFEWYDHKDHTEMTVTLEHGDSGSAILDGYGNLISMAYAYSTDPVRYWGIPLDGILDGYEEITGRELYAYRDANCTNIKKNVYKRQKKGIFDAFFLANCRIKRYY